MPVRHDGEAHSSGSNSHDIEIFLVHRKSRYRPFDVALHFSASDWVDSRFRPFLDFGRAATNAAAISDDRDRL